MLPTAVVDVKFNYWIVPLVTTPDFCLTRCCMYFARTRVYT